MRGSRVAAAAAVLALGALGAGCGSSSSGSSGGGDSNGGASASKGQPFKILFVADTTGPLKTYGLQDLHGLQSAVDYWNAHGGFDGHKISVDKVNSNGDPATAVSGLLRYLGSHPKPNFVFSGTAGNEVAALIPVVAKHQLLSATVNDGGNACAKNSQSTCPTFFTVAAQAKVPQQAVANFFQKKGYKKVGILEASEAFTQTETPAVEAAMDKAGIAHTAVKFPGTATDLTSQLSQLKSQGVDAVYAEVLGPPAGYAAAARAKLGWNVPIIYDVAASSLDITKLAPPSQLKNAYEVVFRTNDPTQQLKGLQPLVSGAKSHGGVGGALPVDVAAFPWDNLIAVKHGVEASHSMEAKPIMQALEQNQVSDPLLLLSDSLKFTPDIHENLAASPDAYPVVPVGPIKNGQVQALGKG